MANASSNIVTLNGKQLALAPIEEDLKDLEELRHDMQDRVDKARDDGRIFMMQEYVMLLAQITSKINKINKRFNRETLASMRKDHMDLRAGARAALNKAKDDAKAAKGNANGQ